MNDTDLQAILSVASSIHSMKQNINCLLIVYHLTFDLRMDSGFEIPESRRLEVQMEMNQLIRTRESMFSWVNHSSHNNTINIRFLKTSIDDMKVGKSVIRRILSLIFAGVLERSPRRRIFQYE